MLPLSPIDQPVVLEQQDMQIFDDVDGIIGKALLTGDPQMIADYVNSLRREGMVRGYALAKLLYKAQEAWPMFQMDGEFLDYAYETMGVSRQTATKYTEMWRAIFEKSDLPDETRRRLLGRPIRDTLLLTAAVREGSIKPDDLDLISKAPDNLAVREAVRAARGEQTSSSSAVVIYLETRYDARYPRGTLVAKNNGTSVAFGTLNLDSEDEMVDKAIRRIINSAGVQES